MKGKSPLLLEPDFIAEGLRTYQTHTNHPRYFMQWSRRFIGLKPFLTLAVAGWKGYADVIRKPSCPAGLSSRPIAELRMDGCQRYTVTSIAEELKESNVTYNI